MIPLFGQNKSKGYIVESGSNDNGNWIKYSDGTMICNKTIEGSIDINISWGSLFVSDNIYLGDTPQTFTDRPVIIVSSHPKVGTQHMAVGNGNGDNGSENSFGYTAICRPDSRTAVRYVLDVLAIGKWK